MNYVGRVYNYWSSISICVITFVPRHRGGRGGGAGGQSTARRNAKGGGSATEPFNGEIYGGEGPGVANLRTKFQLLHDSGTWSAEENRREDSAVQPRNLNVAHMNPHMYIYTAQEEDGSEYKACRFYRNGASKRGKIVKMY